MSTPQATVNRRSASLGDTPPHTTALDWLRAQGLTGAKEGCAEGECGACAIMVARESTTGDGSTEWVSINACLVPAGLLEGQEVLTAEGLGTPAALHPVQQEMAVRGGSQCGYCTPGFVCSMAAEYYRAGRVATHGTRELDQRPARRTVWTDERSERQRASEEGRPFDASAPGTASETSPSNAERAPSSTEHGPNGFDLHALSGNLCRCTGYRPIKDAAYALGEPAPDDELAARRAEAPPAAAAVRMAADGAELVRPADLAGVLELLAERPDAVLVAGSTDWGVEVNLRGSRAALVVAIDRIPELRGLSAGDDEIRLGAALTLTELERRLDGEVPLLAELFPQFASRLIRNGATLGGNLGTASPIGDAPPALLALEAELVLASVRGERVVPLADYFTGYRQSVRAEDEVVKEVVVPRPLAAVTGFHKIAKRRFDDISSVAVAFALDLADGVVTRAAIGLGGVAATPIRARDTEAVLVGRPWTDATVRLAAEVLAAEGTPIDDHRASSSYRAAMLGQSLLKLYALHPRADDPEGALA